MRYYQTPLGRCCFNNTEWKYRILKLVECPRVFDSKELNNEKRTCRRSYCMLRR